MKKENTQEVNLQHGSTKLMLGEEKIRVYIFDFGDMNLVTDEKQQILDWIESDIENIDDQWSLDYKITTSYMTRKELDDLPEWS